MRLHVVQTTESGLRYSLLLFKDVRFRSAHAEWMFIPGLNGNLIDLLSVFCCSCKQFSLLKCVAVIICNMVLSLWLWFVGIYVYEHWPCASLILPELDQIWLSQTNKSWGSWWCWTKQAWIDLIMSPKEHNNISFPSYNLFSLKELHGEYGHHSPPPSPNHHHPCLCT